MAVATADTSTLELSITDGQNPAIKSDSTCYFIMKPILPWLFASGSAVSATNTITLPYGSDDVANFRIESTEFNVGGALTSQGLAVEIEDSSNPGTYIGLCTTALALKSQCSPLASRPPRLAGHACYLKR
ncbi:hypothetical protein OK016_01235 [Vibrio chagasii]|nr:hypothetical protein [Vibrio chagasii]